MHYSPLTFFALATFALTTCVLSAAACGDGVSPTSGTTSGTGGGSSSGSSSSVSTAGVGGMATAGTGGATSTAGTGGATTSGTGGMASSSTGMMACVPSGPETCQDPADEDCDGKECGVWARVFGSPGFFGTADYSSVTPSGEVYFSGLIAGSFQFGGMTVTTDVDHKLVIAKLSASGDDVWIRKLPTQGSGVLAPLAVTPAGGVVFAVAFDKTLNLGGQDLVPDGVGLADTAIAAFAPDGSHIWSKIVAGPSTVSINRVAVSPSGKVAVLGSSTGAVTYDGQPITAAAGRFLFEVDSTDGSLTWSQAFPGPTKPMLNILAFDANGNIVVAGDYTASFSLGGPALPAAAPGNTAAFVTRFDANGNHLKSTKFCDGSCNIKSSFAAGLNGELYVTGYIQGTAKIGGMTLTVGESFILQLTANDDVAWLHPFTRPSNSFKSPAIPDVAVKANGQVMFLELFHDDISFGLGTVNAKGAVDAVFGAINPDGTASWYRSFGAPGATFGGALNVQPTGEVTIAGYFVGAADIGSGAFASTGNRDMMVLRFAP